MLYALYSPKNNKNISHFRIRPVPPSAQSIMIIIPRSALS